MNLVECLEDYRPALDEVEVTPNLCRKEDNSINQGKYIEAYVNLWLERCPEIKFGIIPEKKGIYHFDKTENEETINVITNNGKTICEFDGILEFNGLKFPIEIKSGKLNGFTKKIPKRIEFQKFLFEKNYGSLVLFAPFYKKKGFTPLEISLKKKYEEDLTIINLNYNKRKLKEMFYDRNYIKMY